MRRRPITGALAITFALVVAGCGDDDDVADDETTTTVAPADDRTEEAGEPIAVTAVDYAFEGLPGSVESGAQLTLVNDSTAEVHELVAFRLPDDETRTAEELFALPQAELEALLAGPPAMVLVAPPASDGFPAVGDGTVTEAGRYVVACFIPTGADPDAYLAAAQASQGGPPDVPGGPPHTANGMFGEFTVE